MSFRIPLLARRLHKWLGLLIGAQLVLWALSGLYMTAVHIDIIHGDHLVREAPIRSLDAAGLVDPVALLGSRPGASVRLAWPGERPVFVVMSDGGTQMFDARTGAPAARPDEALIRAIARSRYAGSEPIVSARLIERIPGEIRGRRGPIWRVDFGGWNRPTFYLSAETGELVTRRHDLWRAFDFLWMLHIMDYDTRDNVNNNLLRLFTWAAVLMAASGAWLLAYNLPRRRRRKPAR
ncbi:MAG: PepSY domain-containing protein [Sphingomonas sp.]|nr:PepSY domain-containing protein [Sphingomonas sp.]